MGVALASPERPEVDYREALRRRVRHVCAGPSKPHTMAADCRIARFLPELIDAVAECRSGVVEEYERAVRSHICSWCEHQSIQGECPLRELGLCCVARNVPLIMEVITQHATQNTPPAGQWAPGLPQGKRAFGAARGGALHGRKTGRWAQALIVAAVVTVPVMALVAERAVRQGDAWRLTARSAPIEWVRVSDQTPWPSTSLEMWRRVFIEDRGRVGRFDHFAVERLRFITGSDRIGHMDPVQTVLSMAARPEQWREVPLIVVEPASIRESLGLPRGAAHASFNALMYSRELRRLLLPVISKEAAGTRLTPIERDIRALYARCAALEELFGQEFRLLPPRPAARQDWLSILQPEDYATDQQISIKRSWEGLLEVVRRAQPREIMHATTQMTALLQHLYVEHAREMPGLPWIWAPMAP